MQPEKILKESTPVSGHTVLLEGLTQLAKLENELSEHLQMFRQKDASASLTNDDRENAFFLSMEAANSLNQLIDQGCISSELSYEMARNVEQAGTQLDPDPWRSDFPGGLPPLEILAANAELKRNDIAEDREQARLEALKPITVNVSGRMEYPEDDSRYGTYTVQTSLQLSKADSITEAVNAVAEAYKNNDWNIRDPKRDYYDEDFGRDMGPVSFSPNAVEIVDKDNVRIIGGHFNSGLTWETPATEKEAVMIKEKISALKEQSGYERGWDNHETGRQLDAEAQRLQTRLTGTAYRDNDQVVALLQKQEQEKLKRNPVLAYNDEVSHVRLFKEMQAERLEKKLHEQIAEHKAAIVNLEDNSPGLLASAVKKDNWKTSLETEQSLLDKKEARLEKVSALHNDMGLNGPKLGQLAVNRVRFHNPELARARDKSLEGQRTQLMKEKQLQQGEKKSLGLTH